MIMPCPKCSCDVVSLEPTFSYYFPWQKIKPYTASCGECGYRVEGGSHSDTIKNWNKHRRDTKPVAGRPELVVIRGLPGSGKSTLAAKDFPNHLHYEPDHLISDTRGRYRFDEQFFDEAKLFVRHLADFALARGESVVVSDVFPLLSDIEPYQALAEAHGAALRVIDCVEQFGNCHKVPVLVIEKMRQKFEPWGSVSDIPEFLKHQAS